MTADKKDLDPKSSSTGLNDELKKAVENQSVVDPEDYPEPARTQPDLKAGGEAG